MLAAVYVSGAWRMNSCPRNKRRTRVSKQLQEGVLGEAYREGHIFKDSTRSHRNLKSQVDERKGFSAPRRGSIYPTDIIGGR